jgi:Glyoxalase-like domain
VSISAQVTFDAASPRALAEFWKVALHYETDAPPAPFETWPQALEAWGLPADYDDANAIIDPTGQGPRLYFQRVPEPKTAKNRVHLDIGVGRGIEAAEERWAAVTAHVDRLVEAGATVVDERRNDFGDHWMVMADPEGNEFCVQ